MSALRQYIFFVGKKPYCIWGQNLAKDNLDYLNSIAFDYFDYQAKVHYDNISGQSSLSAAIALRATYHHALESLFSLIGAMLQAPLCVHGWLLKSRPNVVRELCAMLLNGSIEHRCKFQRSDITVRMICAFVFHNAQFSEGEKSECVDEFSEALRRLILDYVNPSHTNEYNSIKHGLRVVPGGVTLAVASEAVPGEKPSHSAFKMLNNDKYGSSYWIDHQPRTRPPASKEVLKHHFYTTIEGLNWSPKDTYHAIKLISICMTNVVACLKINGGASPDLCAFKRMGEPNEYKLPWAEGAMVQTVKFGLHLTTNPESLLTSEDLIKEFDNIKHQA